MKPAKLIEKDISRQITDFMRAHGWRAIRTQFAFSPGSFSTGEPGMADKLFLRYGVRPIVCGASALAVWVELKGPHDKRRCTCRAGDKHVCKQCRQKQWQERERALGAVVIVASDIEAFIDWYNRSFGWLHRGDTAVGQTEMSFNG